MRSAFVVLAAVLSLDAHAEAVRAVAAPERGAVPAFVEVRGTVRPVRVLAKRLLPGQEVLQVVTRPGAHVTRGTPLVYLDDAGIAARLSAIETQRSELEVLRIQVRQARENKAAMEERAGREAEITRRLTPNAPAAGEAGTRLKEASNQLEILERKLELMAAAQVGLGGGSSRDVATILRERLVVRAPFEGTVVRAADTQQGMSPGETVVEVWDDSELVVEAEVWQQQATRVAKGARAEVVVNAGEPGLDGVVKEVAPARNDGRNDGFPIYPATIALRGGVAGSLLPGMAVTVRIYGK